MFVFKGVWKRVVHSYSTIRDDIVKPHCLFFSRMHNLLVSSLVGQSLLSIIKFRTFEPRATRLYAPLCRSVGPSVRRSVGPSHFTFSRFLRFSALLLLPKSSGDLNYGPCPRARDWGSRVSGLVKSTHHLALEIAV